MKSVIVPGTVGGHEVVAKAVIPASSEEVWRFYLRRECAIYEAECAGLHVEGWDAALLWLWAPAWARDALHDELSAGGPADRRAFLACVAFALAREQCFRRRAALHDAVTARLAHEQQAVLRELRAT